MNKKVIQGPAQELSSMLLTSELVAGSEKNRNAVSPASVIRYVFSFRLPSAFLLNEPGIAEIHHERGEGRCDNSAAGFRPFLYWITGRGSPGFAFFARDGT